MARGTHGGARPREKLLGDRHLTVSGAAGRGATVAGDRGPWERAVRHARIVQQSSSVRSHPIYSCAELGMALDAVTTLEFTSTRALVHC